MTGKTTEKQTPAGQNSLPTLLLWGASENCSASLKLCYASVLYGVSVRRASKSDLPLGCSLSTPALVCGQDVVLGGGNAMVKAVALAAGATAPGGKVDGFCEFERKFRRQGLPLEELEKALSSSPTGIHLVGTEDSIADVCVVVALSQTESTQDSWPALVRTYYSAHLPSLEQARTLLPDLLPNDGSSGLLELVTEVFVEAFQGVFPGVDLPTKLVAKCKDVKHGDYQCTGAMTLFSTLKKSGSLPTGVKSPKDIAEAVARSIGTNDVVCDLGVDGPGFIVCRVAPALMQKLVKKVVSAGRMLPPVTKKLRCVVDFSSPNIAKEMHVGHLRSTIIGESVCRILEFAGHQVERVNHVGDWGTQFGMLIQYLKEEFPEFSERMPDITDLTAFYKSAKQRFDEDPDFKKTSQLNVVSLQAGDAECMQIWKILCEVSRAEFKKVYDRLDVNVEERGESFYNDKIPAVIEEFEKAGLVSVQEGGAKCVFVKNAKIPLMLQKSDGGYGYDSTDMAALKYRLQTTRADRIIVITDFSQGDHFKMCYAAARDIGWVGHQKLEHIGFGTVQGQDGKRFKTRSGDTVRLVDLLDEAVGRMRESLKERMSSGKASIEPSDLHEVSEACGYGAVKYFDLRRNPTSNYTFSYDAMLDTKGNTAIYLLYARVRLESIMAKAKSDFGVDVEKVVASEREVILEHPSERNLAFHLLQFPDTICSSLEDLYPYHVCDYVYSLANAATEFVTQCRVLGTTETESRLLLCFASTIAMHQCFDLLGIRHVKRI